MTVHHLGWGADQPAIESACRLAGHEPKTTRQRREPIPPVDLSVELPSSVRADGKPRKKWTRRAVVVSLAEIRAARQRERDDPDGISNRPTTQPIRESQTAKTPEPLDRETLEAFNKWR